MQTRILIGACAFTAFAPLAFSQGIRSPQGHVQTGPALFGLGTAVAAGNFDRNALVPPPLSNPVDYAVGELPNFGPIRGRVTVFSGLDGSVLNVFNAPPRIPTCAPSYSPGADLGFSLAGVGDLDGDGQDDFISGAPESPANPFAACAAAGDLNAGAVFLLSSTGTQTLIPNPAVGSTQYFGYDVCALGDWTGDGVNDFAVSGVSNTSSMVFIYSGQSLQLSATVPVFGASISTVRLAAGPDVDLDGRPDLLVAGPHGGFSSEFGVIFNTATPQHWGIGAAAMVGGIAPFGDLNQNGWPDIVVGDPYRNFSDGGLLVYDFISMAMGTPHASLPGAMSGIYADALGTVVALGGDVNGDGVRDLLVGGGQLSTLVRVVDTTTGATISDTRMTSLLGPFSFANLDDLPVRPDLADQTDGYAETVIGSGFASRSEVLIGGPAARTTTLGGFCGVDQIKVELLDATGSTIVQPVIGSNGQIAVRASTGGELGLLLLGFSFPTGTPFGGCTLFYDLVNAPPFVASVFATSQANTLTPATFVNSLAALGDASATPPVPPLSVTYQVGTIDANASPLSFSFGLQLDLGW
jgi:hypothetical protein